MCNNNIILYTNNLSKSYANEEILHNCNMSVEKGEIFGVLGPNGAGKTTLLKLLTGFIKPTSGNAFIDNIEVEPNKELIQRDIGSLIETPLFYEELSGYKNLDIHMRYMNVKGDIDEVLRMAGLEASAKKPVQKYSLGMRQRLAIARTFIHHPKILILDEPVNGLDPIGLMEMRELFRQLANTGMTIVISSHLLNEINQIADSVIIISKGRVILQDKMEKLEKEQGNDLERYLVEKMR